VPPAGFEPRLPPTPRGNQDRPSLCVDVGLLAGTEYGAALSTGGFSIRRWEERWTPGHYIFHKCVTFNCACPSGSRARALQISKSVVNKLTTFQSEIIRVTQGAFDLARRIPYSSRTYNCEQRNKISILLFIMYQTRHPQSTAWEFRGTCCLSPRYRWVARDPSYYHAQNRINFLRSSLRNILYCPLTIECFPNISIKSDLKTRFRVRASFPVHCSTNV